MPSSRRAPAVRPTVLSLALAAALQAGSAWAQKVGANIDPTAMGYIPTFPMGHETAPGMGVIASSYMWKAGGISVNQEGFRFANENDIAWRCRTIGFEEGLIIRSTLGRMIMAPALIATRAELDELVDKTRIAVDRTAREYGVL